MDMNVINIVICVMKYGYECDIYCVVCYGIWICDIYIYIVLCDENEKTK